MWMLHYCTCEPYEMMQQHIHTFQQLASHQWTDLDYLLIIDVSQFRAAGPPQRHWKHFLEHCKVTGRGASRVTDGNSIQQYQTFSNITRHSIEWNSVIRLSSLSPVLLPLFALNIQAPTFLLISIQKNKKQQLKTQIPVLCPPNCIKFLNKLSLSVII